jgi:hypothetical protein
MPDAVPGAPAPPRCPALSNGRVWLAVRRLAAGAAASVRRLPVREAGDRDAGC